MDIPPVVPRRGATLCHIDIEKNPPKGGATICHIDIEKGYFFAVKKSNNR